MERRRRCLWTRDIRGVRRGSGSPVYTAGSGPRSHGYLRLTLQTAGRYRRWDGVYEIVLSLYRLARRAGVEVKTGEAVLEIGHGRVVTAEGEYRSERVVSDLDSGRLESLLYPERERAKERLSCSGVAVYATLREELPAGVGG